MQGDVNICGGAHRFFVACDGAVEEEGRVKIWVVAVCTVCKESHLIEHLMSKKAKLTEVKP